MARTAAAIARFFRLAFWPLCVSVLIVLLLQPIYFLSLASLGALAPRERTVRHLNDALAQGVLSMQRPPSLTDLRLHVDMMTAKLWRRMSNRPR